VDRPTLEVADVFRQHGDAYRAQAGGSLSTAERRVMTAIEACRTAALGGSMQDELATLGLRLGHALGEFLEPDVLTTRR
jgi:hypothetical protein